MINFKVVFPAFKGSKKFHNFLNAVSSIETKNMGFKPAWQANSSSGGYTFWDPPLSKRAWKSGGTLYIQEVERF